MAHTRHAVLFSCQLWAQNHYLPAEELFASCGADQGYPPDLMGEKRAEKLQNLDPRCRHFSWLVLETHTLGHDKWLNTYGVCFDTRKNAALEYYSTCYTFFQNLGGRQDEQQRHNGEDLQRRFSTYWDSESRDRCTAAKKTWRHHARDCTCRDFNVHRETRGVVSYPSPFLPLQHRHHQNDHIPPPPSPPDFMSSTMIRNIVILLVILVLLKMLLS
jgi:hypothetical protein